MKMEDANFPASITATQELMISKMSKTINKATIDRTTEPRMPWHDVHAVIYGESAQDLARHFY